MLHKERHFTTDAGKEFRLKSKRELSKDNKNWLLTLKLYTLTAGFPQLYSKRKLTKSGEWSTSAIQLVQAQEELELLQTVGLELQLSELL